VSLDDLADAFAGHAEDSTKLSHVDCRIGKVGCEHLPNPWRHNDLMTGPAGFGCLQERQREERMKPFIPIACVTGRAQAFAIELSVGMTLRHPDLLVLLSGQHASPAPGCGWLHVQLSAEKTTRLRIGENPILGLLEVEIG
jgi:hypothetical protein